MNPDPARFPAFNEQLRSDMLRETELFSRGVMTEDRSVLDFLDGRYTFLNERLAKLYGIDSIHGDFFRSVTLDGERRMGVLTQPSILTVTSNPTRTSPVKRGEVAAEQAPRHAPRRPRRRTSPS